MNVEIVKFDNLGRGIGYINNKIIFVPKTIPGDVVEVKIVLEKKNYLEGKVIKIINASKNRIEPICPYFNVCGGCDLMNISLSDSLDYKIKKINDLLKRNKIDYKVTNIIKSEPLTYRNKATLKIQNKKIGYYENDTHNLIKIDKCYLCKDKINNIIKDLSLLNINNGEVIIRTNYKEEILLSINTIDNIDNIESLINNHKIVGIVLNDKCIYGDDYFVDKINDYLFKVSYNSFFQVNPYICSKLFDLIEENTINSNKVLDLYCGVGTLSLVASCNASYVLGVEILKNAIIDANINKTLNNKDNIDFICEDTKRVIDKINGEFDIILDPPRSGVNKNILEKIITEKIKKVIYVSCNPETLIRDLKILENNYTITDFKILDMFPQTEHVESFCCLSLKDI